MDVVVEAISDEHVAHMVCTYISWTELFVTMPRVFIPQLAIGSYSYQFSCGRIKTIIVTYAYVLVDLIDSYFGLTWSFLLYTSTFLSWANASTMPSLCKQHMPRGCPLVLNRVLIVHVVLALNRALDFFCLNMVLTQLLLQSVRRRSPSDDRAISLMIKSMLIVSITEPSLSTSCNFFSSVLTQAMPWSAQAMYRLLQSISNCDCTDGLGISDLCVALLLEPDFDVGVTGLATLCRLWASLTCRCRWLWDTACTRLFYN